MPDAPAIPDPLEGYRLMPGTVRAGLVERYNAVEQAPDERALWAALSRALRYVFDRLNAGELNDEDAGDLNELFIVTKERRDVYLAGQGQ